MQIRIAWRPAGEDLPLVNGFSVETALLRLEAEGKPSGVPLWVEVDCRPHGSLRKLVRTLHEQRFPETLIGRGKLGVPQDCISKVPRRLNLQVVYVEGPIARFQEPQG